LRVIAIDGKSARGARRADGRAVHLLAAFDQASGIVLGQTVVDGKTNEINAFAPLLDRIDITGTIIIADALHTQHRHAAYLRGRGAHYVLTAKRNQSACTVGSRPCRGGRVELPEVDLRLRSRQVGSPVETTRPTRATTNPDPSRRVNAKC
jgi:hypothetical protein